MPVPSSVKRWQKAESHSSRLPRLLDRDIPAEFSGGILWCVCQAQSFPLSRLTHGAMGFSGQLACVLSKSVGLLGLTGQ